MSVKKQIEGWSINSKSGGYKRNAFTPESHQIWMSIIHFRKRQYIRYILAKVSFDPPPPRVSTTAQNTAPR